MTDAPVILAEGLGPLIFYLVIIAFWTLAKQISDKAKNQRKSAGDRHDIDPDLKEFLETLTGQKTETPRPPPRPTPRLERTPPKEQARREPIRREPVRQRPVAEPVPRPQPRPRPRTVATPSLEPDHYREIHSPEADYIAATEIGDLDFDKVKSTIGALTALTRMQSMRLAMSSMQLPATNDLKPPTNHVKIHSSKDLRRSMIDRIVLGPPVSFGAQVVDRLYEL